MKTTKKGQEKQWDYLPLRDVLPNSRLGSLCHWLCRQVLHRCWHVGLTSEVGGLCSWESASGLPILSLYLNPSTSGPLKVHALLEIFNLMTHICFNIKL